MFLGLENAKLPIFNVFPLQTHVVGMRIRNISGDIGSANFQLNSTDQSSIIYSVKNLTLDLDVDIQTVLFGLYTETQTAKLNIPALTATLGIGFLQD